MTDKAKVFDDLDRVSQVPLHKYIESQSLAYGNEIEDICKICDHAELWIEFKEIVEKFRSDYRKSLFNRNFRSCYLLLEEVVASLKEINCAVCPNRTSLEYDAVIQWIFAISIGTAIMVGVHDI